MNHIGEASSSFTGAGFYQYTSGNTFEGEWEDGKPHGRGVYVFANETRVEGLFHRGQRQGEGVQTQKNGLVYEGQFAADKQHGWGRIRYPDGRRYEGCFVENRREGHGVMHNSDGRVEEGRWLNNRLVEAAVGTGEASDNEGEMSESIKLRMPQGEAGTWGGDSPVLKGRSVTRSPHELSPTLHMSSASRSPPLLGENTHDGSVSPGSSVGGYSTGYSTPHTAKATFSYSAASGGGNNGPFEGTPVDMKVDSVAAAIAKARADMVTRQMIAEQREEDTEANDMVSAKKKRVFALDKDHRCEKRKEKLTQSEAYLSISPAEKGNGSPPRALDFSSIGESSESKESIGRAAWKKAISTIAERRRIHVPALNIPRPPTPRLSARSNRSSARSEAGELSEREKPATQMVTYLAVAGVVAAVGAVGAYAWRRYHNRKV